MIQHLEDMPVLLQDPEQVHLINCFTVWNGPNPEIQAVAHQERMSIPIPKSTRIEEGP
jgi:hypothetical protein